MHTRILDFTDGARASRDTAVVIDVFRAFSTACYAFQGGARAIYPVGDLEQVEVLRQQMPDALLVGERHGRKLPGFDFGNSPSELQAADLTGRRIIHTTHAGTQGLVHAAADRVFTGALVNAAATVRVLQSQSPQQIDLVRMGLRAEQRTEEDDLCAAYLASLLEGGEFDIQAGIESLLHSPAAARFRDPSRPWSPERDLALCTDVDRFDFAIECVRDSGGLLCLEVRP